MPVIHIIHCITAGGSCQEIYSIYVFGCLVSCAVCFQNDFVPFIQVVCFLSVFGFCYSVAFCVVGIGYYLLSCYCFDQLVPDVKFVIGYSAFCALPRLIQLEVPCYGRVHGVCGFGCFCRGVAVVVIGIFFGYCLAV